MPIKTLARELNMHDTRLWRVVRHYTEQALERRELSRARNVGFDETSSKRGHDYVSVFVDLDTSKVIFATEGKDSSTLGRFKTFLEEHGGHGENIERMCCDMSPAFTKGAREHFPGAKLTFDKFHVYEGSERSGGQRPSRGAQGGPEPGAHPLSLAEEPSKPDGEAKGLDRGPESEEA